MKNCRQIAIDVPPFTVQTRNGNAALIHYQNDLSCDIAVFRSDLVCEKTLSIFSSSLLIEIALEHSSVTTQIVFSDHFGLES